jgi:hypothetical protein
MKGNIYSLLIWFSGADKSTLDTCSKSEHIKHGGYGALVLFPAVTGTISMSYVISTLSPDPLVFLGIGFIWGIMVLFIDRFIVATFKKSDSILRDIFSISFFIRFVFAIGVGIAVSHPLVLFFFNKSIKQQIEAEKRNSISTNQKNTTLSKNTLNAKLDTKTALRDCLQRLLTAEQSGVQVSTECGYSSGIKECGTRCEKIQKQIITLDKEIVVLQNDLKASSDWIDSIGKLNEKGITENFSDDYSARVEMLTKIEQRSDHNKRVKLFLMLFLIFVDILPVSLKVITKIGEYDLKIREQESKKIKILKKKIHEEGESEVDLISKLTKLKNEKVELIFSKFKDSSINDVLGELAKVFSWEYFDNQQQAQRTEAASTPTMQAVPVSTKENNSKGKFYKALDNEIVKVVFMALILLIEYYFLNYYFGENKDKWAVVMPLIITLTLPLLQQVISTKTKSHN